jgi:xylulokinase
MSLLGIDLGTSGCKVAAFAAHGQCLAQASRPYDMRQSQAGWAVLDSHEVWARVREAIREVASRTSHDPITALATSSFGEAMVPVSRDRRILGNSILCMDARGAEHVARLEQELGQEAFYRINPNILGPQYSLPKLLWLREHEPALFQQADHFLLWGDLVAFLLGCEPVTANSLANRTLLFDLARNDWSDELLAWSGIARQRLGRVVPGGTVIGEVAPAVAAELNLPRGVKVVAGGHDQCCNALGSGCIEAGTAVCGIGTFECITPCYAQIPPAAQMLAENLNVEHHLLPGLYVSFLFNQAGALVKWFRDTFAADVAGDEEIYARLNAELPVEPTRLLTLPHFTPPLWPRSIPDSAGVILGLRTSTTRGEILKSIMECETLYFADAMQSLQRMGVHTNSFIATGGGARSDAWLQIKADIFGIPFIRPRISEGSLLGAAMLAGISTGVFASAGEAASRFVAEDRTFLPDPTRHALYKEKAALYRQIFPATRELLKQIAPTP